LAFRPTVRTHVVSHLKVRGLFGAEVIGFLFCVVILLEFVFFEMEGAILASLFLVVVSRLP
jgi:hypothetical protein